MRHLLLPVVLLSALSGGCAMHASKNPMPQTQGVPQKEYPAIQGYGGIYRYSQAGLLPPSHKNYRMVINATHGAEDPSAVSPDLDKAARIYNLVRSGGAQPQQIRMIVVLHDKAAMAALSDAKYRQVFGRANPNVELIQQLRQVGARVTLCSQSMGKSNLAASDINSDVEIVLSAMTTILQAQQDGYVLLPL
jgi:intracellular sulfur oxidation DsrE/DsrF family protein